MWKLKALQRVRTFVWLLVHNSILTNAAKWRWGLAEGPKCHVCGASKDDNIHTIHDCPVATEVWLRLIPPVLELKFFSLGLREWIQWNIAGKGSQRLDK